VRFFHAPYYNRFSPEVLLRTATSTTIARAARCSNRPATRMLYEGCRRQAFSARAIWVSPETGENAFVADLTLVGPGPCSLSGFPIVQLLDHAGRALPFVPMAGSGQYITHGAPQWVNLLVGEHVYAEIAKYRCDTTSYTRARTATITIGLASVRVAIPPNSNFTYCGHHDPGSQLEISRLVAHEPDLFRH
jgi:Domain of unknown function (DUF4232)